MIIGIGGVSTSGKSILAYRIKEHYKQFGNVKILCQDDFADAETDIPKINNHIDWEVPGSIKHQKFYQEVLQESTNNQIVIAEGLFAFHDIKLDRLYDKRIFLEISHDAFLNRKSKDLRWGQEPDWYIEHIWESYLRFGRIEPTESNVLRLNAEKEILLDIILEYLDFAHC